MNDLKSYKVVGYRDDMWDVEQWRKRNAVSPIAYSEFYKATLAWMNGEGPSPYTEELVKPKPPAN